METYEKHFLQAGELTVGLTPDFALSVWNNVPLLQCRPYLEWYLHSLNELIMTDRYEYVVKDSTGSIIAAMAIVISEDPDVGTNISTKFAHSSKMGALTKGYHWMHTLAKELDVPVMITTKFIKESSSKLDYKLTYHKLNYKD